MTLLPALVPDIPEARAGIVPARLARKVAPLFGIRWDGNVYGLTWVSDFTRLSLSEIARGAPAPTRQETAAADEMAAAQRGWQVVGRAVVGRRVGGGKPEPLRNEIANATLNRFGPDTKAAVVLTGANALLEPVTAAIAEALAFLDRTPVGQLPARLRAGAWAGLVLEAFRSQPALFVAAVQARAIQRATLQGWEVPSMRERRWARSEVGGGDPRPAAGGGSSPSCFDVMDATIASLQLPVDPQPGGPRPAGVTREELRDELTRRWLNRLVALGTMAGEGYLWLSEPEEGHRKVEAFAPHDPTLWRFLTDIELLLPARTDPLLGPASIGGATFMSAMPTIPRPADLERFGPLTRRAVVLALTTLVRLAFNSGSPDPDGDLHTLATLQALGELNRASLPPDDPVRAVTECRIADIRLELVRQDASHDAELGGAVDQLLAELDRCAELVSGGWLNASDTAELIRSACVELMTLLRRHRPDHLLPGVLPPAELLGRLAQLWARMLELMQIELDQLGEQPVVVQRLIGYQLHDYATYLGGVGSEEEARAAVALYRDYVVPARQEFYERTGFFQPLLYSYQNATRATSRLADALAGTDPAGARGYAEQGRRWIRAALAEPYTRDMLERAAVEPTDELCRFALLAVPALLTAVEHAPAGTDEQDLAESEVLLGHAARFAARFAKGGGEYARAGELMQLTERLGRCRTR